MKILNQSRWNKTIFYLIIALMCLLVFANIGNRTMFIDESIEAMLGKNILNFGVPKAWDGKNLIMAEVNGNEFNEDFIYVRKNWLSNYLAAFGQLVANLLGVSKNGCVTIMRCLFALFGVISAIAFYHLCKEMTSNVRVQNIALAYYAFSVNVLLYIRSIYYLAPTLLFIISTLLFYIKFIRTKAKENLIFFTLSSILLFHSFYPYFLITMMSITIIFSLFDFNDQFIKEGVVRKIAISIIIILVATVPWYVYSQSFLISVEKSQFTSTTLFIESLLGYLWQIHAYFFPFIPIGIILIIIKGKIKISNEKKWNISELSSEKHKYKGVILSSVQIFINLLVISSTTNFLDTRRLIGAIPFLFFLLALVTNLIIEYKKSIGYAILSLCIFTNILHVSPYLICKAVKIKPDMIKSFVKPPVPFYNVDENWLNKKTDLNSYIDDCYIASNLQYYLEEICNNYDDADEGIIKFLNKYAKPTDKVQVIGYQYETIAFYTELQVVNRLDAEKDPLPSVFFHYPNATRYEHLTYCSIENCDWIIERRSDSGQNRSVDTKNALWHDEYLFEAYYIDYPDARPWNEIWDHSYVTDDSFAGVFIYRNKLTTDDINLPSNTFSRE